MGISKRIKKQHNSQVTTNKYLIFPMSNQQFYQSSYESSEQYSSNQDLSNVLIDVGPNDQTGVGPSDSLIGSLFVQNVTEREIKFTANAIKPANSKVQPLVFSLHPNKIHITLDELQQDHSNEFQLQIEAVDPNEQGKYQ